MTAVIRPTRRLLGDIPASSTLSLTILFNLNLHTPLFEGESLRFHWVDDLSIKHVLCLLRVRSPTD